VDTDTGITTGVAKVRSTVSTPPVVENVTEQRAEFVAKDLRKWLADTGAKTLYIESGSPSMHDSPLLVRLVISNVRFCDAGLISL
jgi:hypothetical protein